MTIETDTPTLDPEVEINMARTKDGDVAFVLDRAAFTISGDDAVRLANRILETAGSSFHRTPRARARS